MAVSYTRNKWKKADVLTADKLNNTEIALEAIVNKVNGVSYDDNDTPTTLEDTEKIASIQDINDAIGDIPKASTSAYGLVKIGTQENGLVVANGTITLPDNLSVNTVTALTKTLESEESLTGQVTTNILNLVDDTENVTVSLNTGELSILKGIVSGTASNTNITASGITTNQLTVNTELQIGIPTTYDQNDLLIVTPGNPIANFNTTDINFYKPLYCSHNVHLSGDVILGKTLMVPPTVSGGTVTVPAHETFIPSSTSTIYGETISLGLVCREEEAQSNINLYGQIKLVSLDTQEEVTLTADQLQAIKTACNITD